MSESEFKESIKQGIRRKLDHDCNGFISLGEMRQVIDEWKIGLSLNQFLVLAFSSKAFQVNYSEFMEEIFSSSADDNDDSVDDGQAEKEGTVEPLVPWTVVGRPADGRRRRACRQRRRKKNHVIEAAPFGRLDQM